MAKMEFHGRGSAAPCRWVAVHHGGSGSLGLDHIHIAANIVAEDGTVWNDYNDRPRSQAACHEVARELVFEREDGSTFQLSRVDGQAHQPRSTRVRERRARERLRAWDRRRRSRYSMRPASRGGHAAAGWRGSTRRAPGRRTAPAAHWNGSSARRRKAARDEIDFVSLLRAEGLRVKPRFATGGQHVVGYSVAFKGRGRAVVQRHPPRTRPEAPSDPCRRELARAGRRRGRLGLEQPDSATAAAARAGAAVQSGDRGLRNCAKSSWPSTPGSGSRGHTRPGTRRRS